MSRTSNLNSVQKEIMCNFIRSRPDLQSGRFSNTFTFKDAQALWENLSSQLNSVPNGAVKDWRHWRKTWQDLKKNTKSKAVAAKKHASGTGGGEPYPSLSETDNVVLSVITQTEISGVDGIPGLQFSSSDKN
ncbi:hypothetical protein FQR65_LT16354 [Abscondita terminalis]|nr:hypothetical protein FQR65_LT16354 [Abscondita terminalis]